jgi:hypothetical protein
MLTPMLDLMSFLRFCHPPIRLRSGAVYYCSSEKAVAIPCFMVPRQLLPARAFGTIMLNPLPSPGEIKCHPEVRMLPATRENRTEVMNQILNWLTEKWTDAPAFSL